MTGASDYILLTIAIAYWIAMVVVLFKSFKHFIVWFINSNPPMGKLGSFVEGLTMFFPRYLTKEGLENRDQFIKWFSVAVVMALLWVIVIGLAR